MTPLLVACALGTVEVDLDEDEVVEIVDDDRVDRATAPEVDLPLLVAAAAHGSTVVAVVDRRPPLVVSDDGGATWREAGAGLGRASRSRSRPTHPDLVASTRRRSASTSRATAAGSGRRSRSSCPGSRRWRSD